MIAVAIASVPCTITGEIAFGRMCDGEDRAARHADRARGEHEVVLPLREDRPAQQAREDRDLRDADGDHDLTRPGPSIGDDPDREQQARDREHDVHQPHDHAVDDAAEVAGDRAEEQPDRQADGDRDDADQQRVARAVDDARELVAAELVEAEPVLRRRAGQHVPPSRGRSCSSGSYGAISGAKIAMKTKIPTRAKPTIAPGLRRSRDQASRQSAARRLERELTCLDLGDAHQTAGSAG